MAEHNHITHGDVAGCPACDAREGRVTRSDPETSDYTTTPESVKAMPEATHRLVDERFVCEGTEAHKCHWYPGDCDCEYWPCGHDYTVHDRCWMQDWFDGFDLYEIDLDEGEHRDSETLRYPDGVIETEWEGECVLWRLVTTSEGQES